MNYIQVPGDSDVVLWQDEQGNSGVMRAGESGWDEYQSWLAAGNELGSMTPSDTRSITELRCSTVAAINALADATLEPITSQYPRTEIDSWPEQCLEARAWLANAEAHTPLLDAIGGKINKAQMEALCLNIVSKADGYKAAVGAVIAWRRACTSWVENQIDREQLIDFEPKYPEVPHG